MGKHSKRNRRARHDWQRTCRKIADICCDDILNDVGADEAEYILTTIHPEGHRLAGYARYMRRGPKALLAEVAA